MSDPTDPREIRHNAGQHTFDLNPVPPSKDGVHVHHLTQNGDAWRLQENAEKFHGLTPEQIANDLRNMDPKTVRENHLRLTMPRTPYDRDQDRQLRAQAALKRCAVSAHAKESMINRCVSIIRSLEHMEVDKDIALIALETLSEGQE